MHVAYIGNFGPPHSTENHVSRALTTTGHTVRHVQENDLTAWGLLGSDPACDVVLWTRTGWDPPIPHELQREVTDQCRKRGIPVVGFHLDRWWGLNREGQVRDEPFFSCVDLMVTADGGHEVQWIEAGVKHHWMPPAVSLGECDPGVYNRTLASPLAFVGSWRAGYHAEWTHRPQLIEWLRRHFNKRECRFWPERNRPGVRGRMLRDLYASVDVLIGDSCLVGDAYTGGALVERYWSDRIPETMGRGGFLIHPYVEGLVEQFTNDDGVYVGPATWRVGDWDGLADEIAKARGDVDGRRAAAAAGREWVLVAHTYERRMADLLGTVLPLRGML